MRIVTLFILLTACNGSGSTDDAGAPDLAGGDLGVADLAALDGASNQDGMASPDGMAPWDGKELPGDAELPRVQVPIPPVPCPASPTFTASNEAELKAAIADAKLGDSIEITQDITLSDALALPDKGAGSSYIDIYSSGWACSPPVAFAENRPDVPHVTVTTPMKTITTNGNGAFDCLAGAHHFHFVGIELRYGAGVTDSSGLARIYDAAQTQASEQPHHILIDRCRLRGAGAIGGSNHWRAVIMNGDYTAVHQSYLDGFLNNNGDSQAIAGWSSRGPHRITNNFLEGSHENVMFGGATPLFPEGIKPEDIEIRWNHMYKRKAWLSSGLTKNLFEIKFADHVLVEGNIFENFVADAQESAVNIKPDAPPSTTVETSHVTFRRNLFRNLDARWFKITIGSVPSAANVNPHHVVFADNMVDGTLGGTTDWETGLISAQSGYPMHDIAIRRNTGVGSTKGTIAFDGTGGLTNLSITANIFSLGTYGVKASGASAGTGSLDAASPGSWTFQYNVLQGTASTPYPTDNAFPAQVSDVGFVDFQATGGGDLHLSGSSPYKGSANGADPGANVDLVLSSVNGVAYTPEVP